MRAAPEPGFGRKIGSRAGVASPHTAQPNHRPGQWGCQFPEISTTMSNTEVPARKREKFLILRFWPALTRQMQPTRTEPGAPQPEQGRSEKERNGLKSTKWVRVMDFQEISTLADQGVIFVGTSLGKTRSDWNEWQHKGTDSISQLREWVDAASWLWLPRSPIHN